MTKEEARARASIYTAIADGRAWQIRRLSEWRDATESDDPEGWSIERLRIKPEPQKMYVATWFDGTEIQVAVYSSSERLESVHGSKPHFRIDTITRELP